MLCFNHLQGTSPVTFQTHSSKNSCESPAANLVTFFRSTVLAARLFLALIIFGVLFVFDVTSLL